MAKGNTKACTETQLLGPVLAIYIIIRCSITGTYTIVYSLIKMTSVVGRQEVCTNINLITILEHTTTQSIGHITIGILEIIREVQLTPLLQLEIRSDKPFGSVLPAQSNTISQHHKS